MPIEQVTLDKRLIFTVTSGRSGTAYLANLLATIPNVSAHHEAKPDFVEAMRRAQVDPFIAYLYIFNFKLPAIRQCSEAVYAETSHLTCKGFIEPMLRMGLRPSLIMLRRHPREVAWSFMERGSVPGRTTTGFQYLLEPRDLNVAPLLHWEAASNYQLCYWYALEMERRQAYYAGLAQGFGLTTFELSHRQLNDPRIYADMLTTLGLPVSDKILADHAIISAQGHNPNKNRMEMPAHLQGEEEAVWDSVSHFAPLLRQQVSIYYGDTTL